MPFDHSQDTIAAIATPVGEGGISVIRLSGPDAFKIASQIFFAKKGGQLQNFESHTIHLGEIRSGEGKILDQALASLFRAPHSYTAEDVIELSLHGGFAVSKCVLDLLIQTGARHAEPGEFTKRAFLNGKIDLTQAEAVLDLIKAKSEKSLEVAIRQLTGHLSQKLKLLKEDLMRLYAHMEAYLDFPDENLEVYSDKEMLQKLDQIRAEIKRLLASFKRGSILREGAVILIAGKPNVGKSSLFNAFLERDRALVSEYPGTTRDLLEEALEINGLYVRMLDTAGLAPDLDNPLDQMGMERTRQSLKEADLYLFMVDGSKPLDKADEWVFQELAREKPFLTVINKYDLKSNLDLSNLQGLTQSAEFIKISAKTREGLELLEKKISESLTANDLQKEGEQITRLRHKNALESAAQALEKTEMGLRERQSLECVILELKTALDALKELIGEIYSEDLLDVIFSEFCIGK